MSPPPRADTLDRRALLGLALGALTSWPGSAGGADVASVRVALDGPRRPISPLVYGNSDVGTIGGPLSAPFDKAAGVAARRFGGNLTTTYNWTNNACNAGKDWEHRNSDFLLDVVAVPRAERGEPGAVIAHMHRTSLAMGARSLVTLPLAGFVAADGAGAVPPAEAAPSKRFVPVSWTSGRAPSDPVDRSVADIPHFLRRMRARFGTAADATGIRAYALDNEPGLWTETHPRIVPRKVRIAAFIARSVAAARAIKGVDPAAWVFGPASWGATEFVSFQGAPDWPDFRAAGSFLAAYLDAFRRASEQDGRRLLDALDVHWYPFSRRGALMGTEDPSLAAALLDAPRSLTEPGFSEDSWVSQALPVSDAEDLALPILPSLERLAARHFPGTALAVTEFNYGGGGQLASGLALADALGRLGRPSLRMATHWGRLDGFLGQAFRLYRDYDGRGGRFGSLGLDVATTDPASLSAFAALDAERDRLLHLIVLNKDERPRAIDLTTGLDRPPASITEYGFDALCPRVDLIRAGRPGRHAVERLTLPPRAARHYLIAL